MQLLPFWVYQLIFSHAHGKILPLCYIFRITKFLFFWRIEFMQTMCIQSLPQINTLSHNYKYQMVHALRENNFFLCDKQTKHINTLHDKTQWSLAVPRFPHLCFPFFVVINFNNIFSTFLDLFRRFGMRLGFLEISTSHAHSFAQNAPSSAKF